MRVYPKAAMLALTQVSTALKLKTWLHAQVVRADIDPLCTKCWFRRHCWRGDVKWEEEGEIELALDSKL